MTYRRMRVRGDLGAVVHLGSDAPGAQVLTRCGVSSSDLRADDLPNGPLCPKCLPSDEHVAVVVPRSPLTGPSGTA